MRVSPHVRDHLEWLGFIQPTGLVVSAHALEQAGAILNRRDVEGQRRLEESVEMSLRAVGKEPAPFLPDFETFARRVLDWSFHPAGYAGGGAGSVPTELELVLPEYGETLRPDFAVRERDPHDDRPPWQLLVSVLEPGTDLDRVVRKGSGLEASPHSRLERLLRETRVPAGLLSNGHTIRLLSAPRGESSGWMDFHVRDMRPTAGRPLVAAMRLLLRESRLLTGPVKHRLAGLLEASRKYQNVVSERLSEQVLHGLYELLRGFEQAHLKSHANLLAHELEQDPDNVYRALLTVILRLVFLLYAEERGMLTGDSTFAAHYSVVGLHERLRQDAGLHPDTMDDRYGAWAQLLALFRMVHDGAESGAMHLPGRRGALFNPSRFPFLEGWLGSGAPQVTRAIEPPLVPDGTIYRVLEKLLVLDGERISYRALDVEQIGSVYETMMGFRLERATGLSLAVKPKKGGAPTTIDLEKLAAVTPRARAKWIRDRTDRELTPTVAKPLRAARTVTELHAALAKVVDTAATPDLVPRGAMILQPSDERRRSGSHYTPRELTSPIVEEALRPVLDRLADGGAPQPADLLELRVCDPAMGSGAFLVETCRQLAEQLLESWKLHGGHPEVPAGEDELVFARRLVAQRCLYGVDRNPMAVDLAKMSLWLTTLSKDEPLTFLDHALRDGDSLVGLNRRQIAGFTWERGPAQTELSVNHAVKRVAELRSRIRSAGPDASPVEMEEVWEKARAALAEVRFYGDLSLEAFFLGTKVTARREQRFAHLADVQAGETQTHRERLAEKRRGHPPFAPFHWQIEFPEVFERENPGFDAFVGNPPFLGGKRISTTLGGGYRDWLAQAHSGASRNTDLAAHFFRRVFDLLRCAGSFGLIATNTISQGDTRAGGLRWICANGGEIYRAFSRYQWPGQAAVVVSIVHVAKRPWVSPRLLDGRPVDKITAFLFHSGGHEDPERLRSNLDLSFGGSFLRGMGFTFDDANANAGDEPETGVDEETDVVGVPSPLSEKERLISENPMNRHAIFPYIGGAEVNASPTHEHHRFVINFRDYPLRRADLGLAVPSGRATAQDTAPALPEGASAWHEASDAQRAEWHRSGVVPLDYPGPVAADWPELLRIVAERVKPEREEKKDESARILWWRFFRSRPKLQAAIADRDRVLVISYTGQHTAFAYLPCGMVYAHTLNVFPLSSNAAFCALQSRPHEIWARFFGCSLEERPRYPASDVFETFPFPLRWTTHPDLEAAGRACYDFRADLMVQNDEGLTKTYNRFHDPHEQSPGITRLRELHAAMDCAVLAAYGWTDDIETTCEFVPEHTDDPANEDASGRGRRRYRYRWPDPVRDEVLSRLMVLNAERAKEERREAVRD
ncbi:MAG: N-6 DNA methylase [Acidobacteria bacterium]|nr:N-6 DNA methylase [Acidobacteriota bacterium]